MSCSMDLSCLAVANAQNSVLTFAYAAAVTTQTITIDDYSGCQPSADTSFSNTCSAVRSIDVPSTATGAQGYYPCTLGTNAESGRLSKSADGLLVTFYCFRQYAGTTLWDTGNIDPFNGTGIVATIDYLGYVNTTYSVGVDRVGAGNELDGGEWLSLI